MLLLFAAGRVWNARPSASTVRMSVGPTMDTDVTRLDGPRKDVYGNDIETAVGDYRIDIRGDVYERHAPDTAVLRLSSPKS